MAFKTISLTTDGTSSMYGAAYNEVKHSALCRLWNRTVSIMISLDHCSEGWSRWTLHLLCSLWLFFTAS